MSFSSFLALFVISAVCAFVFNSMLKLKLIHRGEGYLCELIMGWIGAWISSPVLGHWSWMTQRRFQTKERESRNLNDCQRRNPRYASHETVTDSVLLWGVCINRSTGRRGR